MSNTPKVKAQKELPEGMVAPTSEDFESLIKNNPDARSQLHIIVLQRELRDAKEEVVLLRKRLEKYEGQGETDKGE